jgi:hypothetical protein
MTAFRYPLKEYGRAVKVKNSDGKVTGQYTERLDDYLYINIVTYEAPGLNSVSDTPFSLPSADAVLQRDRILEKFDTSNDRRPRRSIHQIILPIPDRVSDNNSAAWTEGTINPVAAAVGEISYESMKSNNLLSGTFANIFKKAEQIGSTIAQDKDKITSSTAGMVVNALFGQTSIESVLSRNSGQVFNQNNEFLFNGVTVRPAFTFSFDLTPRDHKEGQVIKEIIRLFKYHSAPKKNVRAIDTSQNTTGLFISAPDVFELKYMMGRKEHPYLHKFKLCALTQMSVDYGASGAYATYADGTPVHMKLTLQFQELSPIFQEDQYDYYETPDKGVGY